MEEYSTRSLSKDLWVFLQHYRWRFFAATLLRVISDLVWLYPVYALATLINFLTTYQPGDSLQPIWILLILYILTLCVRYGSMYKAKMLAFSISERMAINAQVQSIAHMFEIDIAWHERENTGNKLKKILRGGEGLNRIIRIWINNFIEIVINFIGITFVIASFDKTIAFLTVGFLVTYYILARIFRIKASAAAIVVNIKEEDVHGVLFEAVNNIRSVKVLGMAHALYSIIAKETNDLYNKVSKRIFWFQTGGILRGLWAQAFELGMIVFIIYGIVHGQHQVGFLILFYGYFSNLLESVNELADVTQDFIIEKLGIARMVEVLNEPIQIDSKVGKQAFPKTWEKITFKDVSFAYGSNEVLHTINFEIKKGERVGIVGLSGAGKSTLFKLLLKEHESYTGEILIDDVPLRNIQRQDYFRHSAVVLQDTEVFNFSLRDNVVLANYNESKNNALFEKAIRVSHVEDFLKKLPNDVDTLIGEKGVKLSGGERQRVGIARAIFKDPQLLLLDEATSHLDIESEEKIRSSLHEFFQSVTAIVIAHRLTTVKEMDRILVMENGTIVEEGSFNELHAKKGRFHELWEKQKL